MDSPQPNINDAVLHFYLLIEWYIIYKLYNILSSKIIIKYSCKESRLGVFLMYILVILVILIFMDVNNAKL